MHGGSYAVTEGVSEAEVRLSALRGARSGHRTTDLAGALVTEQVPGELLTIPVVAQRLKVSRNTVYRLISSGALAAVTVSRRQRIAEADLQKYIDRNTRVAS